MANCFVCDRKLGRNPLTADTRDGQSGVYVGSECWKLIQAAGDAGYQPPTGGPKLYPDPPSRPLTLDDFFPEESCNT